MGDEHPPLHRRRSRQRCDDAAERTPINREGFEARGFARSAVGVWLVRIRKVRMDKPLCRVASILWTPRVDA